MWVLIGLANSDRNPVTTDIALTANQLLRMRGPRVLVKGGKKNQVSQCRKHHHKQGIKRNIMPECITIRGYAIKPYSYLRGADLRNANLDDADLRGANLHGASLDGADLDGADLRGANLDGANLRNANLDGANLRNANLRGASLDGASLDGADLDGADLRGANLDGASLDGANLRGADLDGADLRNAILNGTNLRGADLHDTDLRGADLRNANLYVADLRNANLNGTNLRGADLHDTDLHGADLYGAGNIPDHVRAKLSILPEGTLIGWKKGTADDGSTVIIKLRIPADAKRSNATGRKCRAAFADVLEITGGVRQATGRSRPGTIYRTGETVHPDSFDEDWTIECGHGIHFFITREEAEAFRS